MTLAQLLDSKQWQIYRGRAGGRLELLPTQLEAKGDTTKFPSLHKYC